MYHVHPTLLKYQSVPLNMYWKEGCRGWSFPHVDERLESGAVVASRCFSARHFTIGHNHDI